MNTPYITTERPMTLLPDEPLRLERLIRAGTIHSTTGEVYRCVGPGPSRRPGLSTREVGSRLRTVSRLADAIGAAGAEPAAVTHYSGGPERVGPSVPRRKLAEYF